MVFPGTLVSPTNKTDLHDITEILLKVALNAITLNPVPIGNDVQSVGGNLHIAVFELIKIIKIKYDLKITLIVDVPLMRLFTFNHFNFILKYMYMYLSTYIMFDERSNQYTFFFIIIFLNYKL